MTVLGVGLAISLGAPSGAGASHDPSGAPFGEDFVTGTAFLVDSTVTLDAHSGPAGEDARGSVVFSSGLVGSVTCLRVEDNRASVGIQFPTIQGFYFVVDNGEGENDEITADVTFTPPTECPSPTRVGAFFGWEHVNVIVHDAPPRPTSKDQCKNGGWRDFGVFKNQGDCVSFVATGGKNPPAS